MEFIRPFLATDLEQFDPGWAAAGHGHEASIFDREDLVDGATWALVKSNLSFARMEYPASRLIFHFPVNDANYTSDAQVRDRLWEAIDHLAAIGATGLVLHANQTQPSSRWDTRAVMEARERFLGFLPTLRQRVDGMPLWIGLENMPATGNDSSEFDPTLVYPEDYAGVCGGNIRATVDFCHLSYTDHVSALTAAGKFADDRLYPHLRTCRFAEVWKLRDVVVHTHFSAFRGIALGTHRCVEGVLPDAGTLPASWYQEVLCAIASKWPGLATMTFEVAERDYRRRQAFPRIVDWARSCLTTVIEEEP